MEFTTLVLRFRLKDKHAKWLSEQAREVDFVWNYCAEFFLKVREREKRFLSAYDFNPYTKGAGKAGLHLHSGPLRKSVTSIRHVACRPAKRGEVAGIAGRMALARLDSIHGPLDTLSQLTDVLINAYVTGCALNLPASASRSDWPGDMGRRHNARRRQ